MAVVNIAWSGEDKPFTVAYADGKLLVGSKEPLENGAIVVIDAHQVSTPQPRLDPPQTSCPGLVRLLLSHSGVLAGGIN